ncbi:uncharacterized protein LOC107267663 [Cephus cinctus]|uniref:Uncharacterized protein LOC107267663 n=1 Tax=Cephus cinctus TaxID=211228 RepID=A0AAJ7FJM9_CEPCN|nr:uncharacterized protein LOC107267663 [Cephus cinctus]
MENESDNDFEVDYSIEQTERAHGDVLVDSASGKREDLAQPMRQAPLPVAQPGPRPRPQPRPITEYPPADEERNYQRRGNRAGRRARQNYAEAFLCRMLRKLASQGPCRARGRGGRRGGGRVGS